MAPHAETGTGFSNGNGATSTANKDLFTVNSPNVVYSDNEIRTKYAYRTTSVTETGDGKFVATPKVRQLTLFFSCLRASGSLLRELLQSQSFSY